MASDDAELPHCYDRVVFGHPCEALELAEVEIKRLRKIEASARVVVAAWEEGPDHKGLREYEADMESYCLALRSALTPPAADESERNDHGV